MLKKIEIYFCIVIPAIISIILSIGLISGLIIVPHGTVIVSQAIREQIYLFAKHITVVFSPIILSVIIVLDKTGIIDINENIIKPKGEENEKN
jgi:hypothetical protein